MDLRFTVLGSGSSGNASVLQCGDFGLLIDFGFGNRQMQSRMDRAGISWHHIQAAIITHTHGDHWREQTLTRLSRLKIPLFCHVEHVPHLTERCAAFCRMMRDSLVRQYQCNDEFAIFSTLTCRAIQVSHDCEQTCAFRFDGAPDLFGMSQSVGYATDLGVWRSELVEFFRNVHLLAIESNHDDALERNSGRPAELVARVLGAKGHLSNDQSAAFVQALAKESDDHCLNQIVLMHLSRQCNRQNLALANMQQALTDIGSVADVVVSSQVRPTLPISVGHVAKNGRKRITNGKVAASRQSHHHAALFDARDHVHEDSDRSGA